MPRNFYKLEIWKLSYDLSLELYQITKTFPKEEQNNLISQIRRASTSVPLNITEGSTRPSKKAYLQFLNYAYGSIREIEVLILFSKDLGYISKDIYLDLYEKINKISRKLFTFIKKVNKDEFYRNY